MLTLGGGEGEEIFLGLQRDYGVFPGSGTPDAVVVGDVAGGAPKNGLLV